ncbi:MAG: hypothetical protein DSM106950_31075 [Stigonema ocellatum SAG 48.90 = DSM 106950]|nr:hypothetical protein [Stigonema ocellatum SAG 48.90 = DSM 106950]
MKLLNQVCESRSESAKGIDEPSALEMALIDEAIANGRARDKYYGTYGWLVIRLTGHSQAWRDFLYR